MVKCPVLWSILGYFGVFNKRASRKSKSPLSLKNQGKSGFLYYGAGRDRTDDPQTASLMLSQLSYSPNDSYHKLICFKELVNYYRHY